MDFDTHFSKTTRAAALRHQQQCPHTATGGLNFLVGAGNAARVRGSFLLAAAPVSTFLWSRHGWPRAFVNGTADSGKHRQRVRHSGRGSAGAISAWLLAASAETKTMAHRRRNELAAGTACHRRRSLNRPRVVEASAHRLTITGALRSPGHSSSGGAWRKGDVSRFECTHSFCVAGSARGAQVPAVMAFDALPSSPASPNGACSSARPSTPPLY
ncbi:uncharacterized protein LOC142567930 [Dermacentor variabilis]|uniref:uncharacterized protein LOC142567930 n=1 Tax=Dermacentor variabilis TaxID=34621 RepID=UPI003F5AF7E1